MPLPNEPSNEPPSYRDTPSESIRRALFPGLRQRQPSQIRHEFRDRRVFEYRFANGEAIIWMILNQSNVPLRIPLVLGEFEDSADPEHRRTILAHAPVSSPDAATTFVRLLRKMLEQDPLTQGYEERAGNRSFIKVRIPIRKKYEADGSFKLLDVSPRLLVPPNWERIVFGPRAVQDPDDLIFPIPDRVELAQSLTDWEANWTLSSAA